MMVRVETEEITIEIKIICQMQILHIQNGDDDDGNGKNVERLGVMQAAKRTSAVCARRAPDGYAKCNEIKRNEELLLLDGTALHCCTASGWFVVATSQSVPSLLSCSSFLESSACVPMKSTC